MREHIVRKAQSTDVPAIDAFDVFPGDRSLDLKDGRLFVSACDGVVTGFGVLSAHALLGHPYLEFLMTNPQHCRRGIASAIVAHIEFLHGGMRFFVSTESNNLPMLALLKKRGYIPAGAVSGANRDGSDELYFYKDIAE